MCTRARAYTQTEKGVVPFFHLFRGQQFLIYNAYHNLDGIITINKKGNFHTIIKYFACTNFSSYN